MKFLITTCMFMCSLFSINTLHCFDDYLKFIKKHDHLGEIGNYKEGKIEIVLDKNTVKKIEQTQEKRYLRDGESTAEASEHSRIGIVAEDKYWVWVRDAVIFPSGATGTYDRIIKTGALKENVNNSVAVIPMTAKGKIVLNVIYRHALRDWVLEIPRGGIEEGETAVQAVRRELREETGMVGDKFIYLGEITPDSGTTASIVPCYFVKIDEKGLSAQDFSEAILGTIELSKEQIKKGYVDGYIEVVMQGKKMKIKLSDSYLAYALLLAEQKKLI